MTNYYSLWKLVGICLIAQGVWSNHYSQSRILISILIILGAIVYLISDEFQYAFLLKKFANVQEGEK